MTIDMSGKSFDRLTVLERYGTDNQRNALWFCRCECGNVIITRGSSLRNGSTKSCGCLSVALSTSRIVSNNLSHGQSGTRLYGVWASMKSRCQNPASKSYKSYGGRGISVCDAWQAYDLFYNWAMATGYDPDAATGICTLDRIDSNGNYCPENCRWVSFKRQNNNRRSNNRITIGSESHTISEWSAISGVKPGTIQWRKAHGFSENSLLSRV